MAATLNYKINFADYFYYDENSPTGLRWKVSIMKGKVRNLVLVKKGDVAGSFRRNRDGNPSQVAVGLMGKSYRAHRIIYSLFNNDLESCKVIDHLDGNPWNNRIENLKKKTYKGNGENRAASRNSPYGISGITCEYQNPSFPSFRARVRGTSGDFHKSFSVTKFGLMPAFKMAVAWRNKTIEQLSETGADYTARHGKSKL